MPPKGYKCSAETKARMSAWQKGKKKRPLTDEHKQRIREVNLGKKHTAETRAKMSASHMGHAHSEETLQKMSKSHKGNYPSEETRRKLSESHKGGKRSNETKARMSAWQKGKKKRPLTDEHKQHIKESMVGRVVSAETKAKMSLSATGEKSSQWQGGKSFEEYPAEFNNQLKQMIRERDGEVCQLCGKTRQEEYRELSVHHIDYDKENCHDSNLITLCSGCNIKVNTNRPHWQEYFENIMNYLL